MPIIQLKTIITAPAALCFDLSRSIELHQVSTAHTDERVVSGVTSGLIGLNESATWEAVHFGIRQKLTSKITSFDRPHYFVDEQVSGAFKSFVHTHRFVDVNGITEMTDIFEFHSPLGILGHLVNRVVLIRYMSNLLLKRNKIVKKFAETERWREVLPDYHP